jgi:hypothetical protein
MEFKNTSPDNTNPLGRFDLIWLLLIVGIAASTRFFGLSLLGPFIDEAGHISLATNYDYYPLYQRAGDGVKVLGFILFYPTAQLFQDPLYATRFMVASSGILTTLGLILTAQQLGGRAAGILAGLFWATLPLVTFHDRLALHDPLISLFLVWALFFLLKAIKSNDWPTSFISGLLVGLTIIIKISALSGLFFLFLMLTTAVNRSNLRSYLKVLTAFIVGFTLPCLFLFLALIPYLDQIGVRSLQYTATFFSGGNPLENVSRWQVFLVNLGKISNWYTRYNSIFFGLYSIGVMLLALARPNKLKLALLFAILFAFFAHTLYFRIWFSRYLLPSLIPMVLLAALVTTEWFKQVILMWPQKSSMINRLIILLPAFLMTILLALSVPTWISTNLALPTDPFKADIPADDQFQYFYGWPSGDGTKEAATFLNRFARNSPAKTVVFTEGFGSHSLWSVPVLIKNNPQLEFRSIHIGSRQDFLPVLAAATRQPTLIFFKPPPEIFSLISPPPSLIFDYKRSHAEGGFQIYELGSSSYLKLSPSQPGPSLDKSPAIITDIFNPNGLEEHEGQKFIGMDQDYTGLTIKSGRAGILQLGGKFSLGPSLSNEATRKVSLKTSNGYNKLLIFKAGYTTFDVPIDAGINEIMFIPLDIPTITTQPNDTRSLLLGVQGLHIANFR